MPYLDFRNKKIYYRIEGEGSPVILLHGFGEHGGIWKHQFELLKESFLVIVPDLPGSGQSELLDGDCSMEDYAEVLKAIADKELSGHIAQSISLIGHSMGGYIILAFLKKYESLVNSFGLFHSSAFADNAEKISTREKGIEFILKNGALKYLETTVPNLFSEQSKRENPQIVKDLIQVACNLSANSLIQYMRAMITREDTTHILKTFEKPILFIIGIHDNAVPLDTSLTQCHLSPVNTVHFLQKSGHVGMWEEKELCNKYLYNFLNSSAYST